MMILVTGATGFLGQQIVLNALARGHQVWAVVRPGSDISSMPWADKAALTVVEADLSSDFSVSSLFYSLAECSRETLAVVHAAGAMTGNDCMQQSSTVEPTRRLVRIMNQTGVRRFILISSMAVYGYCTVPEGAQLDETTPIESHLSHRDAYTRAKVAQESIAIQAAQRDGLLVTVLRPGAIIGPGRLWTPRLGYTLGSLGILLGGNALLPLVFVEHCAHAVVLSVERTSIASDVYMPTDKGKPGVFEIINIVDDSLPTQAQYADAISHTESDGVKLFIRVPWRLVKSIANVFGLMHTLWPSLNAKLPGILCPERLHARFKPLRYSNCRLRDRLGWIPATNWRNVISQQNVASLPS